MSTAAADTPIAARRVQTGPGTPLDPFTATTRDQAVVEQRVRQLYAQFSSLPTAEKREHLRLRREAHAAYVAGGLPRLPAGFISLDASRPWIVFWIVHSLALLDAPMPPDVRHTSVLAHGSVCAASLVRRTAAMTLHHLIMTANACCRGVIRDADCTL